MDNETREAPLVATSGDTSQISDGIYKQSRIMCIAIQILACLFFLNSLFIIVGGNIGGGVIGLLFSIFGVLAAHWLNKWLLIVYLFYLVVEFLVLVIFTAIFPFPILILSLIIGMIFLVCSGILVIIMIIRVF
jgi:hypothetical protein